jgi:hypothetical protein
LHSVALVPRSASVGKWPASVIAADLDKRDWPSRSEHRAMLERAATYCWARKYAWRPGPHLIGDLDHPTPPAPTQQRTATAFAPVVNVTADVAGRVIAVRRPPGQLANKVVLFHGGDVIGRHRSELSDEALVFIIPKTRLGDEALALIADGLLDDVRPVRRFGTGAIGRLDLTAA